MLHCTPKSSTYVCRYGSVHIPELICHKRTWYRELYKNIYIGQAWYTSRSFVSIQWMELCFTQWNAIKLSHYPELGTFPTASENIRNTSHIQSIKQQHSLFIVTQPWWESIQIPNRLACLFVIGFCQVNCMSEGFHFQAWIVLPFHFICVFF